MERFTEADLKEMVLRLAHEIRNPLATIKSGVQLVQHLLKPQGEIEEYLHTVLDAVSRIDRTVTDMQRFVRLDTQTAEVIRVARGVEEVAAAVSRSAQAAGVSLRIAGGPSGISVLMDPAQMRACLSELLENAIRFSSRGTTVTLSWQSKEDQCVVIHVDDEGSGITAENEQRILRPFFSTSTKGTGLGLNIADRICRLYGGGLTWQNRTPRGARFSITLPATPGRVVG